MRQLAGGAQEAVKNVTWRWGGGWDRITARQGMEAVGEAVGVDTVRRAARTE